MFNRNQSVLDRHSRNRRSTIESLEPRMVLDATVVFNEIMYNPPGTEETGEWIELHNQMAVDVDLSLWSIRGGIDFDFAVDTKIPAGGYVVIAKDPTGLEISAGITNVLGPFTGSLSNGGEEIRLFNRNDRLLDQVDYSDSGQWPVGPDGSGATLAKSNQQSSGELVTNWTTSSQLGGTPAAENFPVFDATMIDSTLIPLLSSWNYEATGTDLGSAWRETVFDDSLWNSGDAVIHAGSPTITPRPVSGAADTNLQPIGISNPSFEENTNGGVGYGPVTGWVTNTGAGINTDAGPFSDNGLISDQTQGAFIQGVGSLTQSISGLDTSQQYWLQFSANARAFGGLNPILRVSYAGVELVASTIITAVEAVDAHTIPYLYFQVPFVPGSSAGDLVFENTNAVGDQTLLLDAVSINQRGPEHIVVKNASFEASGTVATDPGYTNNIAGWTFTDNGGGNSGINNSTGPFHDNGTIPDGTHVVFLQQPGILSQMIDGLEIGRQYELQYFYNARAGTSDPNLIVNMGGIEVQNGSVSAVGGANPYHVTNFVFTANATSMDLTFEQTLAFPPTDQTVVIDNVTIRDASLLRTEVSVGPITYYFRHEFENSSTAATTDLFLDAVFDDGAVVYLNGVEIYRQNMPAGDPNFLTFASSDVLNPAYTGLISIPSTELLVGANVLAVEVHQYNTSPPNTDMAMALELTSTETPIDTTVPSEPLVLNEIAGIADAEFFIELMNVGDTPLELSGRTIQLEGDATGTFVLPAGTLAAGDRIAYNQATLGFAPVASGDKLFLFNATGILVTDAQVVKTRLRGRMPDGTGTWLFPDIATPGLQNSFDLEDSIVINEIMFHAIPTLGTPLVVEEATNINFLSNWNYDATGSDLGTAWRESAFDDQAWLNGDAVLFAGTAAIDPNGGTPPQDIGTSTITIENADFEEGSLNAAPGYGGISGWTLSANGGNNDITGPFNNNVPIPSGSRIAFNQHVGSFGQNLEGFAIGKAYTVSYFENGRDAAIARPFVTLGLQTVVAEHDAQINDRYRRVQSAPFIATSSTAELVFGNNAPGAPGGIFPDNTAVFDNFSITRAVPLITNGNFDSAVIAASTSSAAPNGLPDVGWLFTADAGLSRNGSTIQQAQFAVDGNQIGYLQGTSSIVQTINGFETDVVYSLSWSEQMRTDAAANDLEIVLDAGLPTEVILSSQHNVSNLTFSQQTSGNFTATKSSYTLTLRSTNPLLGVNDTTLIDDLRFNFVSEPAPLNQSLPLGPTTYYFRQEFEFTDDAASTELFLNTLIDDGAIFYLNGSEIYRTNMPAGEVPFNVEASSPIGDPGYSGSIPVSASSLINGTNVLAVEVHQATGSLDDMLFGAELTSITTTGGDPFLESSEEWIEIFNRSASETIDLTGWSIDEAVSYDFTPGTMLAPGEFLVIAKDATALAAEYPAIASRIVGNFSGKLSNQDELIVLKDANNNPADQVHYYDDGRWDSAADGGGSTLELRDPFADNASAEAWAASIEGDKSSWQTFTYGGIAAEPSGSNFPQVFHELILGLLDAGTVLLDDISVIEDPNGAAIQRMQNGTFEGDILGAEADKWRIVGNHHAQVTVDPTNGANQVLQLVTTGAAEHMSNHAETTFANGATIVTGQEYEISFRAKWISGSRLLNTRLYFDKLPQTVILDTPTLNGTPAAVNSQLAANIGPTYNGFIHGPIIPTSSDSVTVSVAAEDPHGVSTMTLWYSVDSAAFVSIAMSSADGLNYQGIVPPQSDGAIVQFYVEGEDGFGFTSTFPAAGVDSRALYKVVDVDPSSPLVHRMQLIMTQPDVDFMHLDSNVMSNDRIGATVVFNGDTVFYDTGVRLRGSGFGRRGGLAGFNIRFQPDKLFRDTHRTISIDRGVVIAPGTGAGPIQGVPGASPHELLFDLISNRVGEIASMYNDVVYIDAPRAANTGLAALKMARFTNDFLDSQYENGSDGSLYKYELIYYATTTVDGNPESLKVGPNAVLQTDIQNLGSDVEAYRLLNVLGNNRDQNDFSKIVELGQTLSLSGAELDQQSQQVMDVDSWMRGMALHSLMGTADTYNMGLAHNMQMFVRPEDNKIVYMPWDNDHSMFYESTSPLLGRGGTNLAKVINLPNNRRTFLSHLNNIIDTAYNNDFLDDWINHYTEVTNQNLAGQISSYVASRRAYVLGELPAAIGFAITTVDPLDVGSDPTASLQGNGWLDVRELRLSGSVEALDITWTSDTAWSTTIPVNPGLNTYTIEAYDFDGNLISSDTIDITSTVSKPVQDFLRITELHYNPDGSDDSEFIELKNISTTQTLDLTGVQIADGPSTPYTFTFGRMLAPGEFVLVVKNQSVFQATYPTVNASDIDGEFTGSLSNGGERILLIDADAATVLDFTYEDGRDIGEEDWHPETDGDGFSLVIVDENGLTANWEVGTGWRSSAVKPGSPGEDDPTPLDADINGDGTVDSIDLQLILQNYGLATGSYRSTGDTNSDGITGLHDLLNLKKSFGDTIPSSPPAAAAAALTVTISDSNDKAIDQVIIVLSNQVTDDNPTDEQGKALPIRKSRSQRYVESVDQVHKEALPTTRSRTRTNSLHRARRGHPTESRIQLLTD